MSPMRKQAASWVNWEIRAIDPAPVALDPQDGNGPGIRFEQMALNLTVVVDVCAREGVRIFGSGRLAVWL